MLPSHHRIMVDTVTTITGIIITNMAPRALRPVIIKIQVRDPAVVSMAAVVTAIINPLFWNARTDPRFPKR